MMRVRRVRIWLVIPLAILASLLIAGVADAQVRIERSVPEDGAVLTAPPSEVRVSYNAPVEPRLSTLTLLDARGRVVPGTEQVGEDGSTLVLRLPSLSPGARYYVKSQAVGKDSSVSSELIRFSVQAPQSPATGATPGGGGLVATRVGFWFNAVLAVMFLAAMVLLYYVVFRRKER